MTHQSLLRHSESYASHELGVILADLERRLHTLESGRATSGMKSTSIEGTGLNVYDDSGLLRGVFGVQPDGTVATTSINNPVPPPIPAGFSVEAILSGATVTYSGETLSGAPLPADFSHTNVYVRPVSDPSLWSCVGTITPVPGAFIVSLLEYVPYLIRLTNVNYSGMESDSGAEIVVEPSMVVGQDILDGAVTELKIAADAVTAAAIRAGAVGTAQIGTNVVTLANMADGSVSAAKLIDGAVEMNKIAASAVGANQIAANSIVAGKIATDAIEARHLVAGAVEAGKLAVDSVLAGNIVAQAITSDKIMTFAVTANEIAANAITAGKLSAGIITASKLSADLVLATRIIAGNATAARVEMHPTDGLQGFNNSGLRTFWVRASDGAVSIIGSLMSGTGADRIIIQHPSDALPSIFFYANADPVKPAYINTLNVGGRNALGINSGPTASTGTNPWQTTILLEPDKARMWLNTAPGNSAGTNLRRGGLVELDAIAAHLAVTDNVGQTQSWFEASNGFAAMRYYTAPGTSSANHITMNSTRTTIENLNNSGVRDGGFAWIGRGTQDTYYGQKNTFNDAYLWFPGGGGGADLTSYSGPVTINRVVTSGQAAKGLVYVANTAIRLENVNNDGNRDGAYLWVERGTGDAVIGVNNSIMNTYLQMHGDTGIVTLMGHGGHYIQIRDAGNEIHLQGSPGVRLTLSDVNGGEFILGAPNNNWIRANAGGIEVFNNGVFKAFVIEHPDDADKYLVHGCTESPYGGVEYWGEATFAEGVEEVEVILPAYFEGLCTEDLRQVFLTQVAEGGKPTFVQLAASPVEHGYFTIYASRPGPLKVNWLVKARRRDVEFEVEPRKDEVQVSGWGPYLTTNPVQSGALPEHPDHPVREDPEHPIKPERPEPPNRPNR